MKTRSITFGLFLGFAFCGLAQETPPTQAVSAKNAPVVRPWTDQDSANLAGCYQTELWIFGALIVLPIVLLVRP